MAGAFRPMSAPVAAPFRGVFEAQALRSIPPEEPEERLTVAEVDRLLREREAVVEARVRAELEPRLHELRAALPVLEGALLAVERHRADVLRRAASDVADLALHIARRVVGDAVSDRPDAMHALLTEAIGKLDVSDVARIRVPPRPGRRDPRSHVPAARGTCRARRVLPGPVRRRGGRRPRGRQLRRGVRGARSRSAGLGGRRRELGGVTAEAT